MKIKAGRKSYEVYSLDIETHNDEESIAKRETSMWLGCFIDETATPEMEDNYFYTMDELMEKLSHMTRSHRRRRNVLIYVFHLAFEYSFLFPFILKHGLKWVPYIRPEDSYCFTSTTNKSCSSVWTATLKFGKAGGLIEFRDLNKIFVGSLRSVAKSFGLETQKGEIDYKKNRLHGHIVTKAEKLYVFKDCRIIVEMLLRLKDDKAFWKATSAGSYSMLKMMEETFSRSWKPLQTYRKIYPVLPPEEQEYLRHGVSGGLTYATNRFQFADIKERIGHIDIHQAHPNSMVNHRFPCGPGTFFTGKPPKYKMALCRCKISYSGVKVHSIINQVLNELATDEEVYLWWPEEIETAQMAYYDFEIKYLDGYYYDDRRLPWYKYLSGNYDKRMEAKKAGDKFNVTYYKLLNNSAYGKLIEWPHNEFTQNVINEDGVIDSIVTPKKPEEMRPTAKYTYIPAGACVPMFTRSYLVRSALTISPDGSKIVYVDTDSIFFIEDEETLRNLKKLSIGDKLGDWGIEETLVRAQFTAPKRYKGLAEGKRGENFVMLDQVVHMAGINFRREVSYDELDLNRGTYVIQGSLRCKGGTLIIDKEKVLEVQSKYLDRYVMNADN